VCVRGHIFFLIVVALLFFQPFPQNAVTQDERSSFSEWLAGVRADALSRGIRQEVVDEALGQIDGPLVESIEHDREQPETLLSLEAYITSRVRASTVRTGRQMLQRHRALLERVSKAYGVPAPVIVALWGIESNFGRLTGTEPTVPVLTTLAWDPRRADFFRQELFDALEILNRGDIELKQMRGSWAGAMGQLQFMPSSYLAYAVDFDGDGRRDIWKSPADIFASIANYLNKHGWVRGRRWGREVVVQRSTDMSFPRRDGPCQATRDMSVAMPLSEWQRLGVRLPGGRPLSQSKFPASLFSGSSRSFLLYDNYDALLAYNCAHAYALSVALLADRIAN
jgi:membrane-bound lytic murein transglycosylase B